MARRREFNIDEVLERATLLFAAQGYEATSIRDLKATMGISSSSMYETFGDKRGIYLAVLRRYCTYEQARIAQMAQDAVTPERFIQNLFGSVELAAQPTSPVRGSLAFSAMVEFGTHDPDVTELLLEHYFKIAEIVAEVLAAGQAAGQISDREAPLHVAYTILSTLQGFATLKGVKPDFPYGSAITQVILHTLKD